VLSDLRPKKKDHDVEVDVDTVCSRREMTRTTCFELKWNGLAEYVHTFFAVSKICKYNPEQ